MNEKITAFIAGFWKGLGQGAVFAMAAMLSVAVGWFIVSVVSMLIIEVIAK